MIRTFYAYARLQKDYTQYDDIEPTVDIYELLTYDNGAEKLGNRYEIMGQRVSLNGPIDMSFQLEHIKQYPYIAFTSLDEALEHARDVWQDDIITFAHDLRRSAEEAMDKAVKKFI